VTTARKQYEVHAALDQTRTLSVHVVDVQLSFIRKYAAPRRHTQIFYPTAGDGYHRRNHDVQSSSLFRSQPYTVSGVWKLVRRVDHDLCAINNNKV